MGQFKRYMIETTDDPENEEGLQYYFIPCNIIPVQENFDAADSSD